MKSNTYNVHPSIQNVKSVLMIILLVFCLQSCGLMKPENNRSYPSYRKIFKNSDTKTSFRKFSNEIKLSQSKCSISIIFDVDTIQLDNTFGEYLELFSSGLISYNTLGFLDCHSISIYKIEELTYKFKSSKKRLFKLELQPSNMFNIFITYIELQNKNSHKGCSLDDFLKGAEINCIVNCVQI